MRAAIRFFSDCRRILTVICVAVPLATLALSQPAEGQILNKIKDKAKEAAERETLRQVDNKVTEAVRCAAGDQACIDKAREEGKPVEIVGAPVDPAGAAQQVPGTPGQGAWANYDFVPGERVLFTDDLTRDNVGDFPRRMEFETGGLEIVEWNGSRWLRANDNSRFYIPLPEVLPARFTIEFDFTVPNQGSVWVGPGGNAYEKRIELYSNGHVVMYLPGRPAIEAGGGTDYNRVRRGRIMVDGQYVKVYMDDVRILNVPNADFTRSRKIHVAVDAYPHKPSLLGNFHIAAGGRKLYDALAAEGRVATQGILFDTGSDRIRPESTPTLKEMLAMLREHSELRLRIEGHTDNAGSAAMNQTLSEKRAAAVKAFLCENGIDTSRLETAGFGPGKPVASNDTFEGRQQNRRVELVKL